MIAVYIIGAVLLIIGVLLFLPLNVGLKYENDFYLKIKFAGIRVFGIEPQKKAKYKHEKTDTVTDEKAEKTTTEEAKKFFEKLKKKYGFTGALKSVFGFAFKILSQLKSMLKHIKVNKLKLKILIAGEDAAATAVEYGVVCSAVYPVMALLDSCNGINVKNIDVRSNFETSECEFAFSFSLRIAVIYLLFSAWKIYKEYKNYMSGLHLEGGPDSKENNNERK